MRRIRRLPAASLILATFAIGWSAPVVASGASAASATSHQVARFHPFPACVGGALPC